LGELSVSTRLDGITADPDAKPDGPTSEVSHPRSNDVLDAGREAMASQILGKAIGRLTGGDSGRRSIGIGRPTTTRDSDLNRPTVSGIGSTTNDGGESDTRLKDLGGTSLRQVARS